MGAVEVNMPENEIVRTKNLDRAVAQASLELGRLAEFYKRHDKIKQASDVEGAIAKFTKKKRLYYKDDAA